MALQTDELRQHLVVVDVEEGDASGQDSKILVRDLTRVADDGSQILRGVTVDIPKGMIVGVIGPSGSGKSTFLRSLNRLWEPPAKTVFLDGQDIRNIDVVTLRRRVGMLFQIPALFEGNRICLEPCQSKGLVFTVTHSLCGPGTVADNVRYGPLLRGEKLNDEEVCKLLSLADLPASYATKTGAELSVGQAQRVALARTLANEPEVLLLDEPTSALDPISTENIEDVIVKLKKQRGITTVIVSHSIKQIQRLADIVCLLVNGEIVEVLKPNELSQAKHPMALRFLQLSS